MRAGLGHSSSKRRIGPAVSWPRKLPLLCAFVVVFTLGSLAAGSAASARLSALISPGSKQAPRLVTKVAPTLAAIHALFDPSARATYYTVSDVTIPAGTKASGEPSYTWHLSPPPDDPTCNHFQTSASSTRAAVWFHADVTEKPEDGCHHRTQMHNGTVTVTATLTLNNDSRPWTCVATYFGTLSGDGDIGLCTITAPAVHPVKRPMTPWKVKWTNAGEFADDWGTGIAAMGAAISLTVAGKPIAYLYGAAGAGFKGLGKAMVIKARDPSDPHFTSIVRPPPPRPLHIAPSAAIPRPVAKAANAWADNTASTISLTAAFVTSINRAQGASEAKNAAAQQNQEQAAAGFALQIAALDDARPGLRARLKSALVAAGIHASLTPTQFRSFQRRVAKNGLPRSFVAALRSTGASNAVIADLRKGIVAARVPSAAIGLPASLSNPRLAMTDTQDATLMRAYARLVRG
jgi:hypothetical protein